MDTDDLPDGHFWDSEEAGQEYRAVKRGIAEARQNLCVAQERRLVAEAIALCFSVAPKDLNSLNHALNPYWISQKLSVFLLWNKESVVEIGRNLTLCEAKSETVKTYTSYSYDDKNGYFKQKRLDYRYLKRVEWYTITGEAAVSGLEWALRNAEYLPPQVKADTPSNAEEVVEAARTQALSQREELIQEVRSFLAPCYRGAKWKFVPDLAPDMEAVHKHFGRFEERWKSPPTLPYPPLAHVTPPEIGQRWNDPYWLTCGRWEPYQFPPAQLETVRERIERMDDRIRERMAVAAREVVRIEVDIRLLRRRLDTIRALHYKPPAYNEFWSLVDAPMSIPERSVEDVSRAHNGHE